MSELPAEVELKFQIPDVARAALRAEVLGAGAVPLRLQARYFDTPGRALAGAGFALRLRREDGAWVQTLKGRGDGVMRRLEHEVRLVHAGDAVPALDLARHDATPVGAALRRALGGAAPQPVFETDVRRHVLRLDAGGSAVELALDEGELRAGAAVAPIHELELELLHGDASALVARASDWVVRHGLWLDVRSKAERGERLARGWRTVAPTRVAAAATDARAALRQLLANACELAEGLGEEGHLAAALAGLDGLRATDGDAVAAWRAQLQAAGVAGAGALLRAPAFNRWVLARVAAALG